MALVLTRAALIHSLPQTAHTQHIIHFPRLPASAFVCVQANLIGVIGTLTALATKDKRAGNYVKGLRILLCMAVKSVYTGRRTVRSNKP